MRDDVPVATLITLGSRSGIGDGFRRYLPLEHDLEQPIVLDATALGPCHPMFLIRLRVFLDWHAAASRSVEVRPPRDESILRLLAKMAVTDDARPTDSPLRIPVSRLSSYLEVEELAADLGIGIPEHIRAKHPEWQDDTAAIGRALLRGVTGTGDPHRGNGFAEILDVAIENELVRGRSAATLDIRSARGRVAVELVGGVQNAAGLPVDRNRRGTWLTYTITSA